MKYYISRDLNYKIYYLDVGDDCFELSISEKLKKFIKRFIWKSHYPSKFIKDEDIASKVLERIQYLHTNTKQFYITRVG